MPVSTRGQGPEPASILFVADDQEKDNPDTVDVLLTRELLGLSVNDRNRFQEEIHGVTCLAPKETPALLRESLKKLQQEIDLIPDSSKQAYLKSQSLFSKDKDTYDPRKIYVNTFDFRLRFLRFELFDPARAAVRMTYFLDLLLEMFGEYALLRPVQLTDFSSKELRHLRKGRYQFLPYRDRGGTCGRRILCVILDTEWEAIPPLVRNKIMIYMVWVAGNDVNTQREGLVFVAWFDPTFKYTKKFQNHLHDHATVSVRASAVHSCSSDTPLHRFRRAVFSMRIGENRSRLKQHIGEGVELRYALQSYGILAEQIPVTYTGKVKVTYFRQWLRVRELIENYDSDKIEQSSEQRFGNGQIIASSTDRNNKNNNMTRNKNDIRNTIIESPYLSDIIFRKGSNTSGHPGNQAMAGLIETKTRQELQSQHEEQFTSHEDYSNETFVMSQLSKRTITRLFVSEIIREIQETNRMKWGTCRFLVWNEQGWWTELSPNDKSIHTRVEYVIRSIRNSVTKSFRSSTSLPGLPTGAELARLFVSEGDSEESLNFGETLGRREQKKTKFTSQINGNGGRVLMADEMYFCQAGCI